MAGLVPQNAQAIAQILVQYIASTGSCVIDLPAAAPALSICSSIEIRFKQEDVIEEFPDSICIAPTPAPALAEPLPSAIIHPPLPAYPPAVQYSPWRTKGSPRVLADEDEEDCDEEEEVDRVIPPMPDDPPEPLPTRVPVQDKPASPLPTPTPTGPTPTPTPSSSVSRPPADEKSSKVEISSTSASTSPRPSSASPSSSPSSSSSRPTPTTTPSSEPGLQTLTKVLSSISSSSSSHSSTTTPTPTHTTPVRPPKEDPPEPSTTVIPDPPPGPLPIHDPYPPPPPPPPPPAPVNCEPGYTSIDVNDIKDVNQDSYTQYLHLVGMDLAQHHSKGKTTEQEVKMTLIHQYRNRCGVDLPEGPAPVFPGVQGGEERTEGYRRCLERCEREAILKAGDGLLHECLGVAYRNNPDILDKHGDCKFWSGDKEDNMILPVHMLPSGKGDRWQVLWM